MNTKLGRYIYDECKRKDITVKELSEKSYLSEDYINKIKRGSVNAPSIDTLERLAQGFGMSLKCFLEETGMIDSTYAYALDRKQSIDFINQIKPFSQNVGIDLSVLNEEEIIELANYIMNTIKMIYYKYEK